MAMAVVYATVNGRLVQESRGGTVTRYVSDTLGSCVQTRDSAGNVTSTTEYWPYGEVRTSTGTNPSPWGFVGLLGYLTDTTSRLYVRMRHYLPKATRWLTVDPLWPYLGQYGYVAGDPAGKVDPSGYAYVCGGICGEVLLGFVSAWANAQLCMDGEGNVSYQPGIGFGGGFGLGGGVALCGSLGAGGLGPSDSDTVSGFGGCGAVGGASVSRNESTGALSGGASVGAPPVGIGIGGGLISGKTHTDYHYVGKIPYVLVCAVSPIVCIANEIGI